MAEALASHLGGGKVRAWSAGSHPLGEITPETYEVMREKGISLEGQWSKGLRDVPIDQMDVVVGMGCEVVCPVPSGFKGRMIEWNIPDPYSRDLVFSRTVRDLIERQVAALLSDLDESRAAGTSAAEKASGPF